MGKKKLFSNKKNTNKKKNQLCTAFGYNCFSIKSLLFWKEPPRAVFNLLRPPRFGGRGQPRVPPRSRLAAAGAEPLFSGRRCGKKPPAPRRCFCCCPFVPALRCRTASHPRDLPERTEPGARGAASPRERSTGGSGAPRRGGPDGEYRAGAAGRGAGAGSRHRAASRRGHG